MYSGIFGLFENQYKAKSFTSPWQNTSCNATLISPLLKAKTRPLARGFHMMGNGVEAVDQWGVSGGDPRLTTSLAGPPPRPPLVFITCLPSSSSTFLARGMSIMSSPNMWKYVWDEKRQTADRQQRMKIRRHLPTVIFLNFISVN